MQSMSLMDIDSGTFDISDWDERLPPPAAKTAVQTLPAVIISPEQAGKQVKKGLLDSFSSGMLQY